MKTLELESHEAVAAARIDHNFVRPLYESFCFSNIPAIIENALTGSSTETPVLNLGSDFENVILVFFDAFGWSTLEKFRDEIPALRTAIESGTTLKMTSQFPSTTTAHVTTIHSGQSVLETGIYEWYYFEPILDRVICPFLFSPVEMRNKNALLQLGVIADQIFEPSPLYKRFGAAKIQSYQYQPKSSASSPYSVHFAQGAEMVPTNDSEHAVASVIERLGKSASQEYHYLYLDGFDSKCHNFGPDSNEAAVEARRIWNALAPLLQQKTAKRTLVLITADHGQVPTDPETTQYINELMPELPSMLKRNRAGEIIRFSGGARDLFLHVRDECVLDAVASLSAKLNGRAVVWTTQECIAKGIFGDAARASGTLSKRLGDRIGNVVILPFVGESVFWRAKPFSFKLRGHHGGLLPQEMEIPLMAIT